MKFVKESLLMKRILKMKKLFNGFLNLVTNTATGPLLFASLLLVVMYLFGGKESGLNAKSNLEVVTAAPVAPVKEETLAEVTIWMMNTPKCSGRKENALSEVKKNMEAKKIDRILTQIGGDRRVQEGFIFLVCQESQYRANAKSPAGAIGIAQMMPATAQAEADKLNMGKLTSDDLLDSEINILLGYTHFKGLVDNYNGNIAKASAAYNGGPAGSTLKAMKNGGLGAQETDAYVRSMYDMSEERRIAKIEKDKEAVKTESTSAQN